mmetsp:Transcript_16186/g.29835  ORF Transcript_16186/g.29835 Transcript_16186/m.29835 type:complete len:182 (+) Transcript_16186:87-632(+)
MDRFSEAASSETALTSETSILEQTPTRDKKEEGHHVVWGGIEHLGSESSSRSQGDVKRQVEVQFLSNSSTDSGSQKGTREAGKAIRSQAPGEPSTWGSAPDPGLDLGQLDNLPSIGSAKHFLGTCKPCFFSPRKTGCDKGHDCEWCHFSHDKSKRNRLSKAKRHRFQDLIEQISSSRKLSL